MTVRFEIPRVEYEANGITLVFSFVWSSGDANDNYVLIDGELAKEGVEYELENYSGANGGDIVFAEPPAEGTVILIYRDTPVTQEVSYEQGEAFQADTHEHQMDKDTRILQEIIEAGKGAGGVVDLTADQQPEWTDILNTAGTDARIVPWTTDGLKSGVAMGEVIPFGGTPPQDTAPTVKLDGYIWWVLGQPATAGGDPEISLLTNAIVVDSQRVAPEAPRAELDYVASTGFIGYGYDKTLPAEVPEWQTEKAFANPITIPSTYLIQLERTSGPTPAGSAVDTWLDATAAANWFVASGEFFGILHVAPDAGGGSPDATFQISRSITLKAVQT